MRQHFDFIQMQKTNAQLTYSLSFNYRSSSLHCNQYILQDTSFYSESVVLWIFVLLNIGIIKQKLIGYEQRGVFLPPQGEFSTLFFLKPQCLLSIFTCSAIWRLGRLWVIEVKGHQVHFWMWSMSWSAINDHLVNLSQCVSPKWSQMV